MRRQIQPSTLLKMLLKAFDDFLSNRMNSLIALILLNQIHFMLNCNPLLHDLATRSSNDLTNNLSNFFSRCSILAGYARLTYETTLTAITFFTISTISATLTGRALETLETCRALNTLLAAGALFTIFTIFARISLRAGFALL